MENKINTAFRHNLKDHIWQKMGREVRNSIARHGCGSANAGCLLPDD